MSYKGKTFCRENKTIHTFYILSCKYCIHFTPLLIIKNLKYCVSSNIIRIFAPK